MSARSGVGPYEALPDDAVVRLRDLCFSYAIDSYVMDDGDASGRPVPDGASDMPEDMGGPAASGLSGAGLPAGPTPPRSPRGEGLRHVDLTVHAGEVVVLCGASGCGKTTLTRVLNGLVPSFFPGDLSGEATVCGIPVAAQAPSVHDDVGDGSDDVPGDGLDGGSGIDAGGAMDDWDKASDIVDALVPHVGSVFQNPKTQYFNADSTAELAFPCENLGWEPEEIRRRVAFTARRFGVERLLGRRVLDLSGGQRQRLAVAAATMARPRLVVMDEPTGNLDRASMRDLRDMVAGLKAAGVAVVIAEHRLAWCADVADRYVLMRDGAIAEEWTAEALAAMDETRLESLGLRATDTTPYRAALARLPRAAAPSDAAVVGVRNLTIGHRRGTWLDRLRPTRRRNDRDAPFTRTIPDFDLHAGETVALTGANGVGKTTLVRTLTGLLAPVEGHVLLDGRPAKRDALTRIGHLVMQDVNYQLFADSVLAETLLGTDATDRDAERTLASLDLLPYADRHPMSLSGGQKQRVAIASALTCGKRFIVLDEPTSGLDRSGMTRVGALLRRLAREGAAVLVVTHDEELAARWCDRVLDIGRDARRDAGQDAGHGAGRTGFGPRPTHVGARD